jgi:photosystem II stability/assembly factor-like uncharacterized protein
MAGGDNNTILRTTNAGMSWATIPVPGIPADPLRPITFTTIAFRPSGIGLMAGWKDSLVKVTDTVNDVVRESWVKAQFAVAWRTTNGGGSWNSVLADSLIGKVRAISFTSDSNAIAIAISSSDTWGLMFWTSDTGSIWSGPSNWPRRFLSMSFGSPLRGVIVGDLGDTFWTPFGGKGWGFGRGQPKRNLWGVSMGDSLNAVAVGDSMTIIRTIDGGRNWTSEWTPWDLSLNAVCAIDKQHQIAVGDGGTILASYSAGSATDVQRSLQSGTVPRFSLAQNYPNPFNPSTSISFSLSARSFVSIRIYDVLGREIAVLVNEVMDGGAHLVRWDASRFPSGIYYYRLKSDNGKFTRSMILLR